MVDLAAEAADLAAEAGLEDLAAAAPEVEGQAAVGRQARNYG